MDADTWTLGIPGGGGRGAEAVAVAVQDKEATTAYIHEASGSQNFGTIGNKSQSTFSDFVSLMKRFRS